MKTKNLGPTRTERSADQAVRVPLFSPSPNSTKHKNPMQHYWSLEESQELPVNYFSLKVL